MYTTRVLLIGLISLCLLTKDVHMLVEEDHQQTEEKASSVSQIEEITTSNPKPTIPTTTASTTTTTTTTTPAPATTTTTPAPTTTTPAPTTTTPAPTTTSAPTTTAAPPTPVPEPSIGKWTSNCILLQMATQLNLSYEATDNTTKYGLMNVPSTAIVHDADCTLNTTQQIELNWGPEHAVHAMTIHFERNSSNVNVDMIHFHLPIDSKDFPNAKANQTVQLIYRNDIFESPLHMSYHCTRAQKFNLTETIAAPTVIGVLRVSNVQLEAFRTTNSTQFSTARDCDSSDTPDVVPIVVGIILAGLITTVLIAYLCARRRSAARGYMHF